MRTLIVLFSIFSIFQLKGQSLYIHPTPQKVVFTDNYLDLPEQVKWTATSKIKEVFTKNINDIFDVTSKSNFSVITGIKGERNIFKWSKMIPTEAEGYYISVTKNQIVLAGSDERGLFYAIHTLKQLIVDNKIAEIEVIDYPSIRYRGVVEGFYGTPWSYEDRMRQIRFYGENKINTYIYGPKDDPYHSSPYWREDYPEDFAQQVKEYVRLSNENFVDFVWAIHPGKDIQWNESDRDALIHKFESMYKLGVRSFAVFFDDISGEGTNPEKQAELLNYIDESFISKKKDVTPLVVCPTIYNKAWSRQDNPYLDILGDKLNSSIEIMWTGDRVVAEIKREGLEWVYEKIHRPAYIWWNFPVSDYVRDHLLMGRVYGNDTNITDLVSGFLTNPMENAEASKVAIYGVAAYTWNPEKFDSYDSWFKSFRVIMPKSYEALEVFCDHNSDLEDNLHLLRREESVSIAAYLKLFKANIANNIWDDNVYDKLTEELLKVKRSCDILLASEDNPALLKEIEPWVLQLKVVGESCTAVCEMSKALWENNISDFKVHFGHLIALQKIRYRIDQMYNQNTYHPGIKTGTLELVPFIDNCGAVLIKRFNEKYGEDLVFKNSYAPHELFSNIQGFEYLSLSVKNNRVHFPSILEYTLWEKDKEILITLDDVYPLEKIEFNFDTDDLNWLKIEISVNGEDWTTFSDYVNVRRTLKRVEISNNSTKLIRITNCGSDIEVKFTNLVVYINQ